MSKLLMWNKNLSLWLASTILVASVSLTACSGSNEDADTTTDTTVTKQTPAEATATDTDEIIVAEGIPVSYNVDTWDSSAVESIAIGDLDAIQLAFGSVETTDENSLDYASNPAIKYRFMPSDAPYLDVIDSQRYLELGWYYANPADSDAEKEQSLAHAQKAHTLARKLMGNEGGKIVADMLSGQIIKNQTVSGQKIELAKCEFYSCMLVINKSAAQVNSN